MLAPAFPKSIIIELTNRCQQPATCMQYCPRKIMIESEGLGDMSWELFVKLMYEIQSSNQNPDITLHRRGESTLYEHFNEALVLARSSTKGKLLLATNAISIDHHQLDIMLNCLDFVNFSITPESNKDSIYYFIDKNRQHGECVEIQASAVDYLGLDRAEFTRIWQPQVDRVRIYACHSQNGQPGSLDIDRGKRTTCVKPFTEMAILWNGNIHPCPHRWLGTYNLGNVNSVSISSVWGGELFQDLRKQQSSHNFTDTMCVGCNSWYTTEGEQGTGASITKV
ncbi:MAG: Radical SAM domain protein [Candidatus Gottesmanbacteria bacterium GW2011_GWB1_49_7]|uniref:Radical SAM domain protein n=1 Tax=Candidatus Gottesmanbacteria bacterium GW2011_GWB1_49_7 TaxID=1618448 RepID=A0A0G1Z1J3_9BACT|nr:MAG: Radical SAM domain protein [Candidatus Gottesmanbacteria bacterium GW2011_GWB1_49_7]